MGMNRVTVQNMADMTGIHPSTVRRWCDIGLIECNKDFRGWRFFPEPEKTAERIKGLLAGEIKVEGIVNENSVSDISL
jgi:DNA-binding transcriptional MerR regulator